jgi:hypothetical protein
MRYEVRWTNGYWKLFDSDEYTDVGLFYVKTEAEKACAEANKGRGAR